MVHGSMHDQEKEMNKRDPKQYQDKGIYYYLRLVACFFFRARVVSREV